MPDLSKLTRKEKISILQLIIAFLCLIDVIVFLFVFRFPEDLRMFMFQSALMSTAIICILFGLSTWFYNSNYKLHKLHIRIYMLVMMFIFCIAILITNVLFYMRYMSDSIHYHFENQIMDDTDRFLLNLGGTLGFIIALLLGITCIYLFVKKLKKKTRITVRA